MHSTPRQHPLRRFQKGLNLDCKRFKTPLEITAAEFKNVELKDMEIIFPYSMPPWQARPDVTIDCDKDKAIQTASATSPPGVRGTFVDGSIRNKKVDIGVYSKVLKREGVTVVKEHAKIIGLQEGLAVQYAELVRLEKGLDLFTSAWGQAENREIRKLNIYSDCKSALHTLQNP